MTFRIIPILSFLLISINILEGQLVSDIIRYSHNNPVGTARSLGIGNAISPIGGDFQSLSENPAGIAIFRKSTWSISANHNHDVAFSTLTNGESQEQSATKNDFRLSSIGMVIAHTVRGSKWKAVNIGVGYNRLNDYDQRLRYNGRSQGSITDRWLEQAQGIDTFDLDPLGSQLAYNANALLKFPDENFYESDYRNDAEDRGMAGLLFKEEHVSSNGGLGEMLFSFGANYNHRLMMGVTLGIPIGSYEERRRYIEDDTEDQNIGVFEKLEYSDRLRSQLVGINAKVGIIWRISQMVRWSLAYETRTAMSVSDAFSNNLVYSYREGMNPTERYEVGFPGGNQTLDFDYFIRTPRKISTGLGLILGKKGFISTDLTYKGYKGMRFKFDRDLSTVEDLLYEDELNDEIQSTFRNTLDIRIGGELALNIWRLRGGVSLAQSPNASIDELDSAYSLGLGLQLRKFYVDLGYRRRILNQTRSPYFTSMEYGYEMQDVESKRILNNAVLTLGFRF